MKTIKFCILIYVFGFALAASAQDIDRYEDFWKQGVLDVRVSNRTANDIVLAGITSNDAEVVSLTIKAMVMLSTTKLHNWTNPSGPIPSRNFQDVPGLKEFLINHWMEQYESHGYIQEHLEGGYPALKAYVEEADLSPEDVIKELKERLISWPGIPLILCTWWSGDSDVYELLWYQQETETASNTDIKTLTLLNAGNFTTPEADAFRIRHLSWPSDAADHAFIAVETAAVGLAMNHPIEALPHLITAGENHPRTHQSIWIALSSYDEDQLIPYAEDIQAMMVSGKPRFATKAVLTAYDRLNRITTLSSH